MRASISSPWPGWRGNSPRVGDRQCRLRRGRAAPTPPPVSYVPMLATKFDLQSHSTHSDGQLPPEEVVRAAAAAGVELLALSDHDSVEGVQSALGGRRYVRYHGRAGGRAVGRRAGLRGLPRPLVPDRPSGPPASGAHGGGPGRSLPPRGRDVRAPGGAWFRRGPHRPGGPPIDRRRARPAAPGHGRGHPSRQRPAPRGGRIGHDRAVHPGLSDPGKPAYKPRTRPTVQEAIGWIHDAGGVAIWAHPFWDVKDNETVLANIDRYREWGLDGVECFYPTFSAEQTRLVAGRSRSSASSRPARPTSTGPRTSSSAASWPTSCTARNRSWVRSPLSLSKHR